MKHRSLLRLSLSGVLLAAWTCVCAAPPGRCEVRISEATPKCHASGDAQPAKKECCGRCGLVQPEAYSSGAVLAAAPSESGAPAELPGAWYEPPVLSAPLTVGVGPPVPDPLLPYVSPSRSPPR